MARTTTKPTTKLGMESLEAREVPAYLSGGVLFIDGTNLADRAVVSDTTLTTTVGTQPAVRVVENGVTRTFLRQHITLDRVEFRGFGGDDYFDNDAHSLESRAWGGDGNDELYGADGTDRLYGGDGNDTLSGSTGHDYLDGDAGSDSLTGHSGNDTLYGGLNDDTISAGSGNDSLYGESGDDRLYGESGNDYLSGSGDDDFLNGGIGVDSLSGGSGRDALLGGPGDEGDTVTGGTGQDRFLDWTDNPFGLGEARTDVAGEDAVVYFRDAGAQVVVLGSNIGLVSYTAGEWTDSQIESVDNALATLQAETNNTRLLKTSIGGSVTFNKAGDAPGSPAGGWNAGGGNITLTNSATTSGSRIERIAIHEIGHNWDSESPMYSQWLALSGWERHIPGVHDLFPPAGKVRSDDGGWWHNATAQFAYNYGRMNPLEDLATSWEAFFGYGGTQVQTKMTHLQALMDYMEALG